MPPSAVPVGHGGDDRIPRRRWGDENGRVLARHGTRDMGSTDCGGAAQDQSCAKRGESGPIVGRRGPFRRSCRDRGGSARQAAAGCRSWPAMACRSAPTSDILDTASEATTRRSAIWSVLSATSTGTVGSPMKRVKASDLASRPIATASRRAALPARSGQQCLEAGVEPFRRIGREAVGDEQQSRPQGPSFELARCQGLGHHLEGRRHVRQAPGRPRRAGSSGGSPAMSARPRARWVQWRTR